MLTEQDVQEIIIKTGKSRGQIELQLNRSDYLPEEGVNDDIQIGSGKSDAKPVKRGNAKSVNRKSNSK